VHRHISGGGDYDDREEAPEHGADASKSSAWTFRFDYIAHFPPRLISPTIAAGLTPRPSSGPCDDPFVFLSSRSIEF
jgi:hypothetical protein